MQNRLIRHAAVKARVGYEKFFLYEAFDLQSISDTSVFCRFLTNELFSDVFLCVQYFRHGHMYWGSLTLAFVLVPSMVVQLFSARWYAADGKLTWCSAFVHCLMLQPLER